MDGNSGQTARPSSSTTLQDSAWSHQGAYSKKQTVKLELIISTSKLCQTVPRRSFFGRRFADNQSISNPSSSVCSVDTPLTVHVGFMTNWPLIKIFPVRIFVWPDSDESMLLTHDALIITMHVGCHTTTIPVYDATQCKVRSSGVFSKQTAQCMYAG